MALTALRELAKSPLGNPIRLAIALYLLSRERAMFMDMVRALNLTPGNLGFHLREMEKRGIVKTYYRIGKRPTKFVELTDVGVQELENVMAILREVVNSD